MALLSKYSNHPLEQLRLKSGMTRKEFCRALDWSDQIYYRYIKGDFELRCKQLAHIRQASGLSDREFWAVIKTYYDGVEDDCKKTIGESRS